MSEIITTTKKQVREAAESCPTTNKVLRRLYPDAFKDAFDWAEAQYRDNEIREILTMALKAIDALEGYGDHLRELDRQGAFDHLDAITQERRCSRLEALSWLKADLEDWQEDLG